MLELEGKIKTKLPAQGGTSARGAWTRQDFVLEYQDGNFPAEACFSAWGQDRVDELARYREGDSVKVSFNVKAREYSGRWYNDLRVRRITASGASQQPADQQYAEQAVPHYQASPSAPVFSAPAPNLDDMPADSESVDDDLPF